MSPRGGAGRRWGASAVMALALAGCGPELDHVDLHYWTERPEGVRLGEEDIVIPEGVAVGVVARAIDEDGDAIEDEEIGVALTTSDTNVLGIAPASVGEPNVFVLYGVSAGSASVDVHVDGVLLSNVPATVQAQP